MRKVVVFIFACLLNLPLQASADSAAGKILFESTGFSGNGKSCKSCHDKGRGLENIADYDATVLQGLINICIEDALKGKPFAENSQELNDIENYIRHINKN